MPASAQSAGVLSFEQAYQAVLDCCARIQPPQSEDVSLLQASGRILAGAVRADRDFPPFPRATRDGYAVRSSDVQTLPAQLRVIGKIKAGTGFAGRVAAGEAVAIMTGAAVPQGADAVVMVEYTSRPADNQGTERNDRVEIKRSVSNGENIVPTGSEARAGQTLLPVGTRFGAAQIALAAACGQAKVRVFEKPRVAILATGDELVDVAETPGPHQIRNSNSYSLAAQVEAAGGEPMRLPGAPDELRKLTTLIHAGLAADMLLLSGGVSMGEFDLVEQALKNLGAEFFFTGALIQPGRPVVFGEVKLSRNTNGGGNSRAALDPNVLGKGVLGKARAPGRVIPFFGLPGNPVSVMVTFDLFARPLLQAFSGAAPSRLPSATARLKKDFRTKTGLTRFLPAILEGGLKNPEVELVPWQGSGDLLASARANCYLVVPPDRELIPAGEMVTVLLR